MQRRFLNKRSAIRTAMRNTQSPADLCNWCQHRIEYCSSVCLIPSVAYCLCWQDPLVRLWPCLDSASVRSRESLVAIRLAPVWAPVILSAKCVVAFVSCGRKPPNFFECEVRSHSFLFPRDSWLQFAGHSHVQVERVYGEGLFETLYKQVLWNIHESGSWFLSQQHWSVPRHVTLWQKMLVTLPVTFPLTVLTISEEYSGSLEADMSENTQVAQVWSEKSFLSLVQEFFGCKQHGTATSRMQVWMGKSCLKLDHKLHRHKQALGNIHELPWLMIPIPAALVCPKTCNTMMAEDTCNIASHLSIDRTHDKRGILRQSWSRHVRESPQLFKCEVRSHSFLLSKSFLDAITATCRLQVYMGKVWFKPFKPFTSKYCGTFMNHPGSWFLPQQH